MKTFPIAKENGCTFAFEIRNMGVPCRSLVAILSQTKGVTDIKPRKLFLGSPDIHAEFKYYGKDYIVWEPWGDNSRYWIGPKNPEKCVLDITELENNFKLNKSISGWISLSVISLLVLGTVLAGITSHGTLALFCGVALFIIPSRFYLSTGLAVGGSIAKIFRRSDKEVEAPESRGP